MRLTQFQGKEKYTTCRRDTESSKGSDMILKLYLLIVEDLYAESLV